ncbi:MAG TPA: hypothetical protein VIY51_03805, partial [Xanthobacteraceae bacterium]
GKNERVGNAIDCVAAPPMPSGVDLPLAIQPSRRSRGPACLARRRNGRPFRGRLADSSANSTA